MANIIFLYEDFFKTATLTATSEATYFPKENVQNRDHKKRWRSNFGEGSGWGNFEIAASVNDRLDFKDSTSTVRAASLTPAVYTADTLFAHLKTQMEAVCSDTFTWAYLESGSDKNKFKVTIGSGTFELLTNSGANKNRSVFPTIGYSDTADKTGASNYTADYVRIHTSEALKGNLGASKGIYGCIIRGLNIQTGGTLKAIFSSNNWSSIAETIALDKNTKYAIKLWGTAKNYQYAGALIEDIDNPAGFVDQGVVSFLSKFQPEINFLNETAIKPEDPSLIFENEEGTEDTQQLPRYRTKPYVFMVKGSTQKGYFEAMEEAVGTSKYLYIVEDPDSALATVKQVRILSWDWSCIKYSTVYWQLTLMVKEIP